MEESGAIIMSRKNYEFRHFITSSENVVWETIILINNLCIDRTANKEGKPFILVNVQGSDDQY